MSLIKRGKIHLNLLYKNHLLYVPPSDVLGLNMNLVFVKFLEKGAQLWTTYSIIYSETTEVLIQVQYTCLYS